MTVRKPTNERARKSAAKGTPASRPAATESTPARSQRKRASGLAKKTPTKKTQRSKAPKKPQASASPVDRWIRRLPRAQQRVIEGLRGLIRASAPELHEAIKWSQPVWSGCAPVCYAMARSAGHVTFGFWNGKALDDPTQVLQGTGSRMRHLKLRRLTDVPPQVLQGLLRQAVALDAAPADPRRVTDRPASR